MESIRFFVENIVYYNEENYYSVLEVSEGDDLFTAVGYLPYISAGETLDAEGEYTVHPMYGKQFSVSAFSVVRPENAEMIEKYLACGAIKGIGAALAKRIVKKFGEDTFRIMEEEPERLAEVKGISENSAMQIAEQIEQRRGFRDAVMYMQGYGIGLNLAGRIYECYGPAVYGVLEKNPYRIADDVDGVGFRLADAIAQRTGVPSDSEFRLKCGIVHTLLDGIGQGHTWVPEDQLLQHAADLLDQPEERIAACLPSMELENRIVIIDPEEPELSLEDFVRGSFGAGGTGDGIGDGVSYAQEESSVLPDLTAPQARQIYLASCYHVEANIAIRLKALNIRGESDDAFVEARIRKVYEETGMEPDEKQAEAIRATVKNGVLIITGGPGTGKTTTINNIIRYYKKDNYSIMLAAPTGRAAKRMTEATGCEAKTIHRLLEYTGIPDSDNNGTRVSAYASGKDNGPGSSGKGRFLRNENDPLDCDVLIVDEMSMVDVFLMDALLKAVVPGTRLVLVGDANQLPSVGAGNVLRDMIASGRYSTVCLSHIFRQAAQSDIILNAHAINSGAPVDLTKKSRDFIFIRCGDPSAIMNSVKKLITEKLPGYVDADTFSIQVLTPTRKGALGVEMMNPELQAYLNPPSREKQEKQVGAVIFREGDKVMQVKNSYDLEWKKRDGHGNIRESGTGVYNGDVGQILNIDRHAETVTVLFDDEREVVYGNKELKELELAYAVTVHKAQGSEYPAVVIPMYYGPNMLMNRNLLYTAVTRARKCVCMVGIPAVFEKMAGNMTESRRYSGLRDRIKEIEKA